MRKHIAIGMILRSDESMAPGPTLKSAIMLGYVMRHHEVEWSLIPVQGMPHSAGRNRVLSTFLHVIPEVCDDLLWLDFGNAFPAEQSLPIVDQYLQAMLTSEEGMICFPSPLRGGQDHDYPYNCFPPPGAPQTKHEELRGLGEHGQSISWELQRLESCGFGMVRMRRAAMRKVFDWTREREGKPEYDSDFGILPGANCFGTFVDGAIELGEDIAFCRRCKAAGVTPWAAIDFPVDHGARKPGESFPPYRDVLTATGGPALINPDGTPLVRGVN